MKLPKFSMKPKLFTTNKKYKKYLYIKKYTKIFSRRDGLTDIIKELLIYI